MRLLRSKNAAIGRHNENFLPDTKMVPRKKDLNKLLMAFQETEGRDRRYEDNLEPELISQETDHWDMIHEESYSHFISDDKKRKGTDPEGQVGVGELGVSANIYDL